MSDTNDDDPKGMRATIDSQNKRIAELETQVEDLSGFKRAAVLGPEFAKFGLDPAKGAGKLAAAAYDGDLEVEAVSKWLTDEGFELVEDQEEQQEEPAGLGQRRQQQKDLQKVRDGAGSAHKQKISHDTFRQMMRGTPDEIAEARQMRRDGLVEPHPAGNPAR